MKKILRAISILLVLGVVTISVLGCRKPNDEYKDLDASGRILAN